MPNRDPYIATAIKEEIAAQSQKEVDSLNRFLDNTIALIDENNMLYDEYMGQILTAREQYSDIADKITDWKEKKIKAKKLADTADKGVKAQEIVEKVNTISMSLNPVAAALQFAAKVLKTELEHELNGLKDTAAIIDPALDTFIRFYGGVLRAPPNERVEGELNRKIRELEERIAARKLARTNRNLKLKERKKGRADRISNARTEVQEHNDRIRAERAAQAQTEADAQALVARATAPVDVTEPEEVVLEGATQGSALTPTVELLENAPIETVTAVVESTATGIPQGGLENASSDLLNIDEDGDGAVTVDEVFDAIGSEEQTLEDMTNAFENGEITEEEFEEFLDSGG